MTASSSPRGVLVRLALTSVGIPVVVIGLSAWFFMSYRLDVIAQQIEATRTALVEGVEGRHLVGQAQRIADTIDRVLRPNGVAVVVEAEHRCMTARGVRKPGVAMKTSRMVGAFRDDPSTRREFLSMIERR